MYHEISVTGGSERYGIMKWDFLITGQRMYLLNIKLCAYNNVIHWKMSDI